MRALKLLYANCTKKFYNQVLDTVYLANLLDSQTAVVKKESFAMLGAIDKQPACLTQFMVLCLIVC